MYIRYSYIAIIQGSILPGSTIMSDMWGYSSYGLPTAHSGWITRWILLTKLRAHMQNVEDSWKNAEAGTKNNMGYIALWSIVTFANGCWRRWITIMTYLITLSTYNHWQTTLFVSLFCVICSCLTLIHSTSNPFDMSYYVCLHNNCFSATGIFYRYDFNFK